VSRDGKKWQIIFWIGMKSCDDLKSVELIGKMFTMKSVRNTEYTENHGEHGVVDGRRIFKLSNEYSEPSISIREFF
jgi:hypothetical protein